jgi:hypothetical protein
VFDRSFHALGLYLERFLVTRGCDRIMELIDPSCKIDARG